MRAQKPKPIITKTFIAKLAAPTKGNRIVYDTEPVGFGVRITAGGAASYVLRYLTEHGTERRYTIGPCNVWEPEAARDWAKDALYRIKHEKWDPLDEKKADRSAATVNEVLDDYLLSKAFTKKAATTQYVDKGRIARHVRPLLGKKVAVALSSSDIEQAFDDIVAGKTKGNVKTKPHGLARVTGGTGTAKKAMQLLGAALEWAKVTPNPVRGVDLGEDGVRKLILTREQYVQAFDTLDRLEAAGEVRTVAAEAIRVLALTGARRGEIAGLPRAYLSPDGCTIVRPPTAHKTGRKTGEARIITLPEAARTIVKRQPAGAVVFPIDGPALTRAWTLVRAEAKLPPNFGLHGLRHSLASHLAMGGAQGPEIMTAMGHKDMATSAKYIHWVEEARAELAERAAGPALAAMPKLAKPTPEAVAKAA